MFKFERKGLHFSLAFIFVSNLFASPYAVAGDLLLPAPGAMVPLSPDFAPPTLKGLKVHVSDPFRFDFILDRGDGRINSGEVREESVRLIKYFLAGLTVPEKDLWVNLSPYEKDRIVPQSFGLTEMGRDLLSEDYILKQITASLIYPEEATGRKFWKRVYEEAYRKYGTTSIPVNTFNKVWIVPQKCVVYENAKAGTAYIVDSRLKVMLDEDYLSMSKHQGQAGETEGDIHALGSQIVREIVLPELEKEVNEGRNFSQLRQVYQALILAAWYKKKIKESIFTQVYSDKNKIAGIAVDDPQEKQKIYGRYLKAFQKGVYNYIKDDLDPATQKTIPRKYFSGGTTFNAGVMDRAMSITTDLQRLPKDKSDNALIIQANISPFRDRFDRAMKSDGTTTDQGPSVEDRWMKRFGTPLTSQNLYAIIKQYGKKTLYPKFSAQFDVNFYRSFGIVVKTPKRQTAELQKSIGLAMARLGGLAADFVLAQEDGKEIVLQEFEQTLSERLKAYSRKIHALQPADPEYQKAIEGIAQVWDEFFRAHDKMLALGIKNWDMKLANLGQNGAQEAAILDIGSLSDVREHQDGDGARIFYNYESPAGSVEGQMYERKAKEYGYENADAIIRKIQNAAARIENNTELAKGQAVNGLARLAGLVLDHMDRENTGDSAMLNLTDTKVLKSENPAARFTNTILLVHPLSGGRQDAVYKEFLSGMPHRLVLTNSGSPLPAFLARERFKDPPQDSFSGDFSVPEDFNGPTAFIGGEASSCLSMGIYKMARVVLGSRDEFTAYVFSEGVWTDKFSGKSLEQALFESKSPMALLKGIFQSGIANRYKREQFLQLAEKTNIVVEADGEKRYLAEYPKSKKKLIIKIVRPADYAMNAPAANSDEPKVHLPEGLVNASDVTTFFPKSRKLLHPDEGGIFKFILGDRNPFVADLSRSRGDHIATIDRDAAGRPYYFINFNEYAIRVLGYNRPELKKALARNIHEVVNRMAYSDFITTAYAAYVKMMMSIAPKGLDHIFVANTGAEANENAFKALKLGRPKSQFIIAFEGAYHGRTPGALSVTAKTKARKGLFKFPWSWVSFPETKREEPSSSLELREEGSLAEAWTLMVRGKTRGKGETLAILEEKKFQEVLQNIDGLIAQYNNLQLNAAEVLKALHELKERLPAELFKESENVTGFIAEPYQGEGGMKFASARFFQRLRCLTALFDVPLIFDEVQSGFFVTGTPWAFEAFNLPIPPDIVTFSKKAQMGGMYVSDRYYVNESGKLDSTWGGSDSGIVRAVAYEEIIRKEGLVERAKELGAYALDKLRAIEKRNPALNLNTRGWGLVLALDLPNETFRDQVVEAAWRRGLIINLAGARTIRILPCFDTKASTIDEAFEILEEAVTQVARENQPAPKVPAKTDPAMSVRENGGIDLNNIKDRLQVQDQSGAIKFHIDPELLQQLQNAPGFIPVIINIQPMNDLPAFLGNN